MHDVSHGRERLRAWPQPRGKGRSAKTKAQNETFRQAVWACKYHPAEILAQVREAVKDTPLLPYDLLIANLYGRLFSITLTDGKRLYPMAARIDVSESLDVLSQIVGSILLRGDQFWEGLPIGDPGQALIVDPTGLRPVWGSPAGGGAWQTITSWSFTIDGAVSQVVSPDLTGYSEVEIVFDAVTASASGFRYVQVSVNGGLSYDSTLSYHRIGSTGVISSSDDGFFGHTTASSAARYSIVTIEDLTNNRLKKATSPAFTYYYANASQVTNVRAFATGAGNTMNGGSIQIRAR